MAFQHLKISDLSCCDKKGLRVLPQKRNVFFPFFFSTFTRPCCRVEDPLADNAQTQRHTNPHSVFNILGQQFCLPLINHKHCILFTSLKNYWNKPNNNTYSAEIVEEVPSKQAFERTLLQFPGHCKFPVQLHGCGFV